MNKKAIIGVAIAAVMVPAAAYAIAPLFFDTTINEEIPENVLISPRTSSADESAIKELMSAESVMAEKTDEMTKEGMTETAGESMIKEASEEEIEVTEPEQTDAKAADDQAIGDSDTAREQAPVAPAEAPEAGFDDAMMEDVGVENTGQQGSGEEISEAAEAELSEDDISRIPDADVGAIDADVGTTNKDAGAKTPKPASYTGTFVPADQHLHYAEGTARVLPLEDGGQVLRFEDFYSRNGPDLYVYLATDERASEFVNLGELKANSGNQNYEIPEGTDITKYDNALVWCKLASALFGSAELVRD